VKESDRSRTLGEQSPRIFHGSKRRFRVVFCFESPDARSKRRQKSLKTMDCVVGAVGIEPTTSPV